jgi:hypothetical protein
MNYHLVVGLLGSGQGSFAQDLRDVLREARGSSGRVAVLHWGSWESWSPGSSLYWPVSRVLARAEDLKKRNPELTDLVIFGPWMLDHWSSITEFGSRHVYWIDRIDHNECRSKSMNFWTQTLSSQSRIAQSEFVAWLDRQEQLWSGIKPGAEWQTLRTMVWDQDSESVVIIPADSHLSYLKQVTVEHF